MYEHKEGSASLFKNDKKGNDKAPDWKGDGLLNGKKVKLAAWEKHGTKGTFFSIKIEEDNFKPKVENVERKGGFESDEIPFNRLTKHEVFNG